jgi:diacylglycerol kinase family enzyme
MKRWELIRDDAERLIGPFTEVRLDGIQILDDIVRAEFRRGERRFVGAGGDGTVNAVLNALMRLRGEDGFDRAALGAVGLGSSNDFHKGASRRSIHGHPARIDFANAGRHDVGCIEAPRGDGFPRRYFLVNASVGVTAEGNALFNEATGLCAFLKRISTAAAISWAALAAILRHANLDVGISLDGGAECRVSLSNLAVLQSPHISGGMRAPVNACYGDGMLRGWIEKGLSRPALLGLFIMLTAGRYTAAWNARTGPFRSLRVRGKSRFPIEFDGEVVYSDDVRFSLFPGALRICA